MRKRGVRVSKSLSLLCASTILLLKVISILLCFKEQRQQSSKCMAPLQNSEIFLPSNLQNDACVRRAKIQACLVLQKSEQIGPNFSCSKHAHEFVSSPAIALHLRWEKMKDKPIEEWSPTLRRACTQRIGGCSSCRQAFLLENKIDIRIDEKDYLSLRGLCNDAAFTDLYEQFRSAQAFYVNYFTVRPSDFDQGVQLFSGPVCRPQRYCEPLSEAIRHFNSISGVHSCGNTHVAGKLVLGTSWEAGLASSLHVMSHDVAVASYLSARYHLLKRSNFNWADKRDCSPPTLQCYYDVHTQLCSKQGTDAILPDIEEVTEELLETVGYRSSDVWARNARVRQFSSLNKEDLDFSDLKVTRKVAEQIVNTSTCFEDFNCSHSRALFSQKSSRGYLQKQFIRAASVRFFQSQLSPWVNENIDAARKMMPLVHPLVSMHIRRGDKHQEMQLLDTEEYLKRILPVMIAFGVRNIFLSTEDPEPIASAMRRFSAINWIFTDDVRKNPSWHDLMASNLTEEFLLAMRNLYLAAEADFFIGTRESNWCRLIDETQKANGLGGTYYIDAHGHLEESEKYTDW